MTTNIETTRVKAMRPHIAPVSRAWVVPGGMKVITVDRKGLACITNLVTGGQRALKFQEHETKAMTLSKDGRMMVVSDPNGSPVLYDLHLRKPAVRATGALVLTEEMQKAVMKKEDDDGDDADPSADISDTFSSKVACFTASNGMVFVAYANGSVGVWDARAAGMPAKLVQWISTLTNAAITVLEVSSDNSVLVAVVGQREVCIWRQNDGCDEWDEPAPEEAAPHEQVGPPSKDDLYREYKCVTSDTPVRGGDDDSVPPVAISPSGNHVTVGSQVTYIGGQFPTSLELTTVRLRTSTCTHMDSTYAFFPASSRFETGISAWRYSGIESRFIGSTARSSPAIYLRHENSGNDLIALGSTADEAQLISVIRSGPQTAQAQIFDLMAGRRRAATIAALCMQQRFGFDLTSPQVQHMLLAVLAPPALDLQAGEMAGVRAVTLMGRYIPCIVVKRYRKEFRVVCLPLCDCTDPDLMDYAGVCANVPTQDVAALDEDGAAKETVEQNKLRVSAQLVAQSHCHTLVDPVAAADTAGQWTSQQISLALRRSDLIPAEAVKMLQAGTVESDGLEHLEKMMEL